MKRTCRGNNFKGGGAKRNELNEVKSAKRKLVFKVDAYWYVSSIRTLNNQ